MSGSGNFAGTVTLACNLPTDVSIGAPGGHGWLKFHSDGRVTADPTMAPDDQARAIIGLLVANGWLKYAAPWRDISTAKRDMDEIILFCPKDDPQVCTAIYIGGWKASASGRLAPEDDFYGDPDLEPSHWMPLPAPPETKT